MKITVCDFDAAADRAGQYVGNGYRVTHVSAKKIVLSRLPNLKFANLPEEIRIEVKSK